MARRGTRIAGWIVGVLVVVVAAGLAIGGWYYTGQLLVRSVPEEGFDDGVIQNVAGDLVVLPDVTDTATAGTFGLHYPNGYAQLTEITSIDDGLVTRRFEVIDGTDPQPGSGFDTSAYAYPDDPRAALGIDYEEVDVPCGVASCPAWFVDGSDDTWAIFTHGRGATRAEALRVLQTTTDLGLPGLVISYRNDGIASDTEDGVQRFGDQEWEDLDAAVDYALENGAGNVVLVGYSQGGGITAQWLLRSEREEVANAAILDAPLLDLHDTLVQQARLRSVPEPTIEPILFFTEIFARLRVDLDAGRLDADRDADELDTPILLVHGAEDDFVPIGPSDELAEARPDLVTYLRFEDVGHVRGWNAEQLAYEQALTAFLREHAVGVG